MAEQGGIPHFIPACYPFGVGNIQYQRHAYEVQGRGCTTYFECFGFAFLVCSPVRDFNGSAKILSKSKS